MCDNFQAYSTPWTFLKLLESSLFVQFSEEKKKKACWFWPLDYSWISMQYQADSWEEPSPWNAKFTLLKRPKSTSYSREIQDVEIPWTLKYIQAYRS